MTDTIKNTGELEKRIIPLLKEADVCHDSFASEMGFGSDKASHDYADKGKEILSEMWDEFPLDVIVETIKLYSKLKNHSEEEKKIVIDSYLDNCNLKGFILKTVDWFKKWGGSE